MFNVGGGRQRANRQQRGSDLRCELDIDFVDAINYKETEVKLRRLEACSACHGSGSASGRGPITCAQCQGRGQIRIQQGFFAVARTCGACGGTGTTIADPCSTCRGESLVPVEFKLLVKIPPGVEEGSRIRYSGAGNAGRFGGPSGDLYIEISVREHEFFERRGNDLYCVVPITFPQAALGAEIEIPAINGNVQIKVPKGTQNGKELRIRGKGVPLLNGRGQGDMVVKVLVQVPKKLSRAQRELIAKLAESLEVDNKPASPGILEKMKDLFS
jgi:molecular chaperone DnaJ